MDRPTVLTDCPMATAKGDSPEGVFAARVSMGHRKRLGQFFTPMPIARAMTAWCCRARPDRMLDPSIGPGIFPACALELPIKNRPRGIVGYDIDVDALAIARERLCDGGRSAVHLHHADFLSQPPRERFDAIVCNPPYIRHHDAKVAARVYDELEAAFGLRFSRMTNVYALFLLRIARLLSDHGRAAVITPAEFLNADFGVAIKAALLKSGLLRGFVIFDHAASVFEGIMTTAAITLLDANAGSDWQVRWIHVDDSTNLVDALDAMDGTLASTLFGGATPVIRTEPDPREKWATVGSVDKSKSASNPNMRPLSDFATCSRGIATGANDFFTLTRDEAQRWELPEAALKPCVTKAPQVRGSRWTDERMAALIEAGKKAFLLDAAAHADNAAVKRYIAHGESRELHLRYLTRHRTPWYAIERRGPADIWVATFGRGRIRFVWNQSSALHLTAFHGLYLRPAYRAFAIHLLAYLHSESGAAECRRNHRVYGDGLLKFEPRDVERLSVPDFDSMPSEWLAAIEAAGVAVLAADGGEISALLRLQLAELFD